MSELDDLKAKVATLEQQIQTLLIKTAVSDPSRMITNPVFQGPVTVSIGNTAVIINGVFANNQSSGIEIVNLTTGEKTTIDSTTFAAFGSTAGGGFVCVALGSDGSDNGLLQMRNFAGVTKAQINGGDGEVLGLTLVANDGGVNRVTIKNTTSGTANAGGGVLPATPRGFVNIAINGVDRKVPFYDV